MAHAKIETEEEMAERLTLLRARVELAQFSKWRTGISVAERDILTSIIATLEAEIGFIGLRRHLYKTHREITS